MEKYTVEAEGDVMKKLVGDSHRFKTPKGEISLIYPSRATMNCFEIYCIAGDLFEDTERYITYNDAYKAIERYLK